MNNKKKSVPKPKIKRLTKSQKALLRNTINEAETDFRASMAQQQTMFGKMLEKITTMQVENFKDELGLDDEWKWVDNKLFFVQENLEDK